MISTITWLSFDNISLFFFFFFIFILEDPSEFYITREEKEAIIAFTISVIVLSIGSGTFSWDEVLLFVNLGKGGQIEELHLALLCNRTHSISGNSLLRNFPILTIYSWPVRKKKKWFWSLSRYPSENGPGPSDNTELSDLQIFQLRPMDFSGISGLQALASFKRQYLINPWGPICFPFKWSDSQSAL